MAGAKPAHIERRGVVVMVRLRSLRSADFTGLGGKLPQLEGFLDEAMRPAPLCAPGVPRYVGGDVLFDPRAFARARRPFSGGPELFTAGLTVIGVHDVPRVGRSTIGTNCYR